MSKSLTKKVATQALVVSLAVASGGLGMSFAAAPAMAVALAPVASTPASVINWNKDRQATLTIVKLSGDHLSKSQRPTGEKVDNVAPETPLQGAVFTIQRLKYDFHDPAQLAEASKITPDEAANNLSSDPLITGKPTGSDGSYKFTGLKLGAYLVTEKTAPAGRVKVKPFVAFVPSTSDDGTSWNYDVYAYPKDTAPQTVSKALSTVEGNTPDGNGTDNDNANTGDVIYYDVTAKRPPLDKNKQYFTGFNVYDKYSPELIPDAKATDKFKLSIGGTELKYGTDFTMRLSSVNQVKYWFYDLTKSGLDKLTKSDDGAPIKATFPFTVGASGSQAGFEDHNIGGVSSDRKDEPTPGTIPEVPTPTNPNPNPTPENPESPNTTNHWVKVTFTKTDESGNTGLQGAKFQVYRCTKGSGAVGLDTGSDAKDQAKLDGKALTFGKSDSQTITSGANGAVTIDSLRVFDKEQTDKTKGYCLVETEAPIVNGTHYALLQSPYFFHVSATKDGKSGTINYASDIADNLKIKDRESNVPKLPATGGMGVGLLMALGVVIVAGGVYYARRSSKTEA